MVENPFTRKTKKAVQLFCELVDQELSENIKSAFGSREMVAYLVKHNLIRQSIINRYLVIRLYPDYKENYGREQAVNELSKVIPLETKAIYHILSNHSAYFHPNKLKI
jgi:hypothetical protein